jgi:hypothetical protein
MSDFYGGGDFQKGKSKTLALKPWQSQGENTVVVQTKKRCWDGLFGCEQYKSFDEFKVHHQICSACITGICLKYHVPRSYADYLMVLLWQENSLQKSAKTLGASKERLGAMEKAQEFHVAKIFDSIFKAGDRNANEVKRLIKVYRKWFYEQAGVGTVETADHVKGFSSVGLMV